MCPDRQSLGEQYIIVHISLTKYCNGLIHIFAKDYSEKTNQKHVKVCEQPLDPGPCRGSETRFFGKFSVFVLILFALKVVL